MTIEAVARQYFMDFLENLGDCEYGGEEYVDEEYIEEQSNQIIADDFFSGELVIGWDTKEHELILMYIDKGKVAEDIKQLSYPLNP